MIKRILPSIFMGLGLFFLSANVSAQLNYTVSFPTITYAALSGAVTNPTLVVAGPPAAGYTNTDEGAANGVALPFPFKFNGITYTTCNISTNGFLTFGSAIIDTLEGYYANSLANGPINFIDAAGNYVSVPNSRPIIAPLWDDLDIQAATNLTTKTAYVTGTSGPRIFTIEWKSVKWNYAATGTPTTGGVMSFQVKLYEADYSILFHYKTNGTGNTWAANSGSAAVGLADVLTGSGNYLSINTLKSTTTSSSTFESDTIKTKPATNFAIKFTPIPTPTIDAGITLIAAPTTVTCLNSTQSLTYTIKNAGTNAIAPGTAIINLTAAGANTGTYSGSNTKTLAFNELDTVTISGINLNNPGYTTLNSLVGLAGDTRAANDTSKYAYTTASVGTNFPIYENCVVDSLKLLKYRLRFFGSQLWIPYKTSTGIAFKGETLLPYAASDGDTSMFVFLGAGSGSYSVGWSSLLYTDCLQLPAGQPSANYSLNFYSTSDSANVAGNDSLYVNISTDKGAIWNRIPGAGYQRYDGTVIDHTWNQHTVDLSAYAGQTIQIGFEGVSQLGNLFGLDEVTLTANYPLPITLSSFTGTRDGLRNILKWGTVNETNNKGFELQRSLNGKDFGKIGYIDSKATNGNSSTQLNYTFTDENSIAAATNYYRLRQLDKNGKESYSNIVALKSAQINKAEISSIYPNPVQDNLNILLNTPSSEKVTVAITDLVGKTISQQILETAQGDNNIQFNTSKLAKGTYLVKIYGTTNIEIATQKFVKQ